MVVEADVSSGDGDTQFDATVCQAGDGLGELPHHFRVFRGSKVQTVTDRERFSSRGGHVSIRLGEGLLGSVVGVEVAVAGGGVCREGNTEARLFVYSDHPRIVGGGHRRITHHVVVVLVGYPLCFLQVGGG